MMDEVLAKYGNMTASELVSETHKEGTLWYRTAARAGLLEAFNKHECNNSDQQINFTEAMSDSVLFCSRMGRSRRTSFSSY